MTTLAQPLIEAPASDETTEREMLAYVDAFDAVLNTDHAFLAIKETHRVSGAWWIRILALHGPDSVFHPNAIRLQARAAGAQGKSWFNWGHAMAPTASDPRSIVFRVHVRDGHPATVDMLVRMRRFDHGTDELRSATFLWPVV